MDVTGKFYWQIKIPETSFIFMVIIYISLELYTVHNHEIHKIEMSQ